VQMRGESPVTGQKKAGYFGGENFLIGATTQSDVRAGHHRYGKFLVVTKNVLRIRTVFWDAPEVDGTCFGALPAKGEAFYGLLACERFQRRQPVPWWVSTSSARAGHIFLNLPHRPFQ